MELLKYLLLLIGVTVACACVLPIYEYLYGRFINRETGELPSNVIGYLKKPINWKMLIDVLQNTEEKKYA